MEAYDVLRQLGKGGMGTAYCVRRNDGGGGGGFLALKKVACRNVAEGNAALGEAKTLQVSARHVRAAVHRAAGNSARRMAKQGPMSRVNATES